ncbi:hypothetical protein DFS34DRAFT_603816 [Phlyctochytrium arcticum]|nr:hypothetical protein DFS34DRAFT_603816 [Phlyctochytrium arcticum]
MCLFSSFTTMLAFLSASSNRLRKYANFNSFLSSTSSRFDLCTAEWQPVPACPFSFVGAPSSDGRFRSDTAELF